MSGSSENPSEQSDRSAEPSLSEEGLPSTEPRAATVRAVAGPPHPERQGGNDPMAASAHTLRPTTEGQVPVATGSQSPSTGTRGQSPTTTVGRPASSADFLRILASKGGRLYVGLTVVEFRAPGSL